LKHSRLLTPLYNPYLLIIKYEFIKSVNSFNLCQLACVTSYVLSHQLVEGSQYLVEIKQPLT